jgi:hypothetical protein
MFTTEKLEKYRKLGIPIDDGLILLAQIGDRRKAEKEAKKEANSIPTISLKNKSMIQIDADTKVLLEFVVDGEYNKIGRKRHSIDMINTNNNVNLSTAQWQVEKGWTFKTYITAKKGGPYTLQFKIDGQWTNSFPVFVKGAWIENNITGEIKWNKEVTSASDTPKGFTYIGLWHQREKIWRDVEEKGKKINGLMKEIYKADETLTVENLTPWMNLAHRYIGTTEDKDATKSQEDIQRWIDNILRDFNLIGEGKKRPISSDNEPWCGVFVYAMLTESGIIVERGKGWSYPSLARFYNNNWKNSTKLEKPQYGAVVVIEDKHVAFIDKFDENYVWLLGGNQSVDDAAGNDGSTVNVRKYNRKRITCMAYPII